MKLPSVLTIALAALFLQVPGFSFGQDSPEAKALPRTRDLKGIIFNDPNGNGRLDSREKGGAPSTIWLYRVLPNGTRRKVRKIQTNAVGQYVLRNVPFGRYFMAIRYNSNKLAVRTGVFVVGRKTNVTRNIPFATLQNLRRYPNLTRTPNPDNLDKTTRVSPFAP